MWQGLLRLVKALLLLEGAALLLALVACQATVEAPAEGPVGAEELAVVWEAWEALETSYLNEASLDTEAVVRSAITALLEVANVPAYPLLTRLHSVAVAPPKEVPLELEDIWRTWYLLLQDQPEIGRETLAQMAAQGLVQGVGDPFTRLIPAEEYEEAREFLEGSYEGIGALVADVAEGVVIATVFPDSPAAKAGLQQGDFITEADGVALAGLSLDEMVRRVKGPRGTEVHLKVRRPQVGVLDITVVRGDVQVPTVATDLLPSQVGYVRISQFGENTSQELRDALEQMRETQVQGLVLDLRSNPGGSLPAAVEVASQFLREGLVLYEVDRGGQRKDSPVQKGGLALDLPLAVLVNRYTASASEVVAGALQDHQRAPLFGTTTFGKGSVLNLQQLSDGSVLYVTSTLWYTPNGKAIQGTGIQPDVLVDLSYEDMAAQQDTQLLRAHQYLVEQLAPEQG